jgi:hypothetical protein
VTTDPDDREPAGQPAEKGPACLRPHPSPRSTQHTRKSNSANRTTEKLAINGKPIKPRHAQKQAYGKRCHRCGSFTAEPRGNTATSSASHQTQDERKESKPEPIAETKPIHRPKESHHADGAINKDVPVQHRAATPCAGDHHLATLVRSHRREEESEPE